MPGGVARVVVAVAAEVDVVVAQEAAQDAVDARVVEQAGEVLALPGEGHDAGAPRAVVGPAVVAAAVARPDPLEGLDDGLDAAGEVQEPEGLHEVELLRCQAHGISFQEHPKGRKEPVSRRRFRRAEADQHLQNLAPCSSRSTSGRAPRYGRP